MKGKKLITVLTALVLVFVLTFGSTASAMPAAAQAHETDGSAISGVIDTVTGAFSSSDKLTWDSFKEGVSRLFYISLDNAINKLASIICKVYPSVERPDEADYKFKNSNTGTGTFKDEVGENARWNVGYSSATLLTGNELDGKHYVGGSLSFPSPKNPTAILDDLRVRVVAISDGTDSGIVVFAVLDAYGLANKDVRIIRDRIAGFLKNENVVSVNISTLHQHSAIDTLGLNGDLLKVLFGNTTINALKLGKDLHNGQNKEYMENLYNVTAKAIMDAVNSMEPGEMYLSTSDASEYIRDKRDPQVIDPNLNRLCFVPDDENSTPTWIVNAAIHCVGLGAATTEVSGDYPYFVEKAVNEAGANYIQIQGAELAITSDGTLTSKEGATRYENVQSYGAALGKLLVDTDKGSKIEPILNIAHENIFMQVDNKALQFIASTGLLANEGIKTADGDLKIPTEIGYMEIGDNLAFALIPGELAPEIAFGGAREAKDSWLGKDWNYPSMQDIVGKNRKLMVLGLTNDQIGYILSDNDYRSILTENEELLTVSKNAGSRLLLEFKALYEKVS
ncbi:MAG: hypothetical protein PUB85_01110 [Clostridia bacterium]|nr:hypothetical protein [Clostridia bacterium]